MPIYKLRGLEFELRLLEHPKVSRGREIEWFCTTYMECQEISLPATIIYKKAKMMVWERDSLWRSLGDINVDVPDRHSWPSEGLNTSLFSGIPLPGSARSVPLTLCKLGSCWETPRCGRGVNGAAVGFHGSLQFPGSRHQIREAECHVDQRSPSTQGLARAFHRDLEWLASETRPWHSSLLHVEPVSLTIGRQQERKHLSFIQSLSVEFPQRDRDFPFFWGCSGEQDKWCPRSLSLSI